MKPENDQSPKPPVFVQSPPSKKSNKPNKTGMKIRIGLVLILLVIFLGYEIHHSNTNKSNSASNSQSSNKFAIDYVTIPTHINEAKNYPNDSAQTAQGHYVYIDTSAYNNNNDLGGKLIYDGKTIYNGANLATSSYAISQNGQHYAYMRYANDTSSIYVDNKLVKKVPGHTTSYAVVLYAVSNNGKNYAYGYAPNSQSVGIYKNGSQLYKNTSTIFTALFSSDLTNYVAAVQIPTTASNVNYDVIKNSKDVGSGSQAFISPNGQHYMSLVGNGNSEVSGVAVDGKTIGKVTENDGDSDYTAINDNGTYGYTDFYSHLVNINGTNKAIPASIPDDCGQGCINLFAVNQTDTHYIVGDYKPGGSTTGPVWDLDGKTITLKGDVEGLEFNHNTLYVYKWSN
jgi:hypothetical protein